MKQELNIKIEISISQVFSGLPCYYQGNSSPSENTAYLQAHYSTDTRIETLIEELMEDFTGAGEEGLPLWVTEGLLKEALWDAYSEYQEGNLIDEAIIFAGNEGVVPGTELANNGGDLPVIIVEVAARIID